MGPKEKCAVAGVVLEDENLNAAAVVYESLFAMQHRGTEASGIAAENQEREILEHRRGGMVIDVYSKEVIDGLSGHIAIGHNRYSTSGHKEAAHPQPFVEESLGLALSVNGNLPDTTKLEDYLSAHGIRAGRINDTQMIGYALAQQIREGKTLPEAIELSYPLLVGAFSCVALHNGQVAAFRDPYGVRPLALGRLDSGLIAASETCGLDIIDATYLREVNPGEMVTTSSAQRLELESKQLTEGKSMLDMFELVYFARHDSYLYGHRVNEVRKRFGERLAVEHPPLGDDSDKILVVPVPDTSVPAAEGYAEKLGLTHRQSLIKNRYIGRTFMQPTNDVRRGQLRRKHNIISESVRDKDVILIDDSIIRLNTIPRLVELVHAAGASSVSVLIASSPVRYPDFYGIDIPSQRELASANLTVDQMRERIGNGNGCKYLGFLSLEGMVEATGMPYTSFNLSCFTGDYPIDIGERRRGIYTPIE